VWIVHFECVSNLCSAASHHLNTVLDKKEEESLLPKVASLGEHFVIVESRRKLRGCVTDLPDEGEEGMTPLERIESARAQWRHKREYNLEESWTSLNLFDRSQKGRISLDLQGLIGLDIVF
jgi:hypothetical protein